MRKRGKPATDLSDLTMVEVEAVMPGSLLACPTGDAEASAFRDARIEWWERHAVDVAALLRAAWLARPGADLGGAHAAAAAAAWREAVARVDDELEAAGPPGGQQALSSR